MLNRENKKGSDAMYKISKIIIDELELFPDITETSIWEDYDDVNCSNRIKIIAALYDALSKRENYFQLNTPTAFGNPDMAYYRGLVIGILQGSGMEEIIEDEKIVIKKGNRKVLVVDKVNRPQSYHDAKRENNKLLKELGM